jgi:hypothetical protein
VHKRNAVAHRHTWRLFLGHSHFPTLNHPTETKKPQIHGASCSHPGLCLFFIFYYYVIIITPLSHIPSFAHIAVSWSAPFFKSPAPPTLPGGPQSRGPQSLGSRMHPGVGSVLWRRRLVRILLVLVTATAVRAVEREREGEGGGLGGWWWGGGGGRERERERERE